MSLESLKLVPSDGGAVQAEILEDDFPTRYPFLGEPKAQRITGTKSGEDAYGQFTWVGAPSIDAFLDVEIVTQGNKASRFQWSTDGGSTFEENGVLVPLGDAYALGDTGYTANWGASPEPEFETEYSFTGAGAASQSGAGPTVTISGSGGAIDGLIRTQTGIGSFRYRLNGGTWSSTQSMTALPISLPFLGSELDIAPEDELRLLLEAGAVFSQRIRGFFGLRLTRGQDVETYERLKVGMPLWFVSADVPASRRSKLLKSASWSGTVRPRVGTYTI